MNVSVTLKEEDIIEQRKKGDEVPALKPVDPSISNYDFEDLGSAVEFAKVMSQAGPMLPKHAVNNPGVCLALLYRARHWGIDPFGLALESYQAKTDQPIAYQARVYTAVAINNGINLDYEYTGDTHFENKAANSLKGNQVAHQTAVGTRQVIVTAVIDGKERVYISPMLKDIKVKNSPLWHNDPDQQLAYYGARAWMRRYRPDLMMGAMSVDEVQDRSPMRDVTPSGGGFSRLAQAARDEAETAPDDSETAETDSAEHPDEREPDTESPAYTNGIKAAEGGLSRGDCPYVDSPDEAVDWFAGWDMINEGDDDTADEEPSGDASEVDQE